MIPKKYEKYSKNFKYFMNTYMFIDSNSESFSFLVWLIIFKSNINIGFVTNFMSNGKQVIKTIFRYIDNLPTKLKPKIKTRTKTGFTLENNVRFFIITESNYSKRISFSYLFVDGFNISDKLKRYILRNYANLIHKQIRYCNPDAFKYALENLAKTHLFVREKTIANSLFQIYQIK